MKMERTLKRDQSSRQKTVISVISTNSLIVKIGRVIEARINLEAPFENKKKRTSLKCRPETRSGRR
jgi:hypothetical protein